MSVFLIFAYLFFFGSLFGWCLEVIFRRFFSSANPERKWLNPGFCKGPYLPIYGAGLCVLYAISFLDEYVQFGNPFWEKIVLFVIMAVCVCAVEFVAGLIALKGFNLRLWDYRNQPGNIMGLICPKFLVLWGLLCAAYYFLLHDTMIGHIIWLSENLAYSFVIGLFYGVFLVDLCISAKLGAKISKYAKENNIEIKFERVKVKSREKSEEEKKDYKFFNPIGSEEHLQERLEEIKNESESVNKEK